MIAAGLLFLALAVGPDAGATAPAPGGSTATAAPTDDQVVVCKTMEITGTRFPERICKTKASWAADTQNARDFVNKSTSGACTGSVCH